MPTIEDAPTRGHRLHGINDDGNGLNSYGEMRIDVIEIILDA